MDERQEVLDQIHRRIARERVEDNESLRRANEAAEARALEPEPEPEQQERAEVQYPMNTARDRKLAEMYRKRSEDVAMECEGYSRTGEAVEAFEDFKSNYQDIMHNPLVALIAAEVDSKLANGELRSMPAKERMDVGGEAMREVISSPDFVYEVSNKTPSEIADIVLQRRTKLSFEKTRDVIAEARAARGQSY